MEYNKHTLPNGLRIIHLASASQVIYCGYGINAGTRDELQNEEGLAHFCEHVTFKGTKRRSSMQILNCLEKVGGDLNAFTNKEDTVYYSAILKSQLGKAVDLLTDIVFHSTYPQHEIDKEVEVICDEIESYNDSPSELIYDDFENIIFNGHPLGHNILGEAERLRLLTTSDALRFTKKHYIPANAVFFAYGDIDFDKLVRMIEKAVSSVSDGGHRHPIDNGFRHESLSLPTSSHDLQILMERGTHQAHVMIGNRAYSAHDDKRFALYLLNNILGGPGMSARLNISLREQRGLVYTVESSMVNYSDTGIWSTYFGCDHKDVKKCLQLVHHELDKVMQKPLSNAQLSRAKMQIKGQIGIASDNRETFALDFGKTYLHYGREKDIERLYATIDSVTAEQTQEVAQEVFAPSALTTLIYP